MRKQAPVRQNRTPRAQKHGTRRIRLMFHIGWGTLHRLVEIRVRFVAQGKSAISKENRMNAKELADKFNTKTDAAVRERERQSGLATEYNQKRSEDIEHCKRAMESNVLPFLVELKQHLGDDQFTFAPQINMQDHKPVGVSFKIGDGGTTSISTALGNIIVTRAGDGGTRRGVAYVYPPDAEPYISSSGDLTRDKIARLIEMVIDNT
jgi:hypothetical protein